MEGQELRRSVTLSERISAVDSSNLRDLLKVRDDDEARPSRRGSITLASVLASEKLESAVAASGGGGSGGGSGRTLLDIMRQEQEMNGSVAMDGSSGNGVNWNFKDGILHRRTADAWFDTAAFVPSHPAPLSHPEFVIASPPNPTALPRSISLSVSTRNTELPQQSPTSADVLAAASAHNPPPPSSANTGSQLSANVREVAVGSNTAERSYLINDDALARAPAPSVEEQQQPRISLMALLEQTDGHWGGSPSPVVTVTAATEVEDEAIDHTEEHNGIRTIYICCVCMVRQKGAAFIPCGHTFCRLCSRELWVSRGSCPLCNGYILEILDIF